MAGKTATISMLIGGDASGLRKATKNASKSLSKFSKSSANAAKKVGKAFGAMTGAIGVAAVGLGAKAVDLASDFDESMSKTEAIFKEAAGGITAAAKDAATAVGMSKGEFLEAASGFGVFGKAAGLGGDDLSDFAAELVKTAADVASFNNLSTDQALEKLSAGLRGSSEPLQSLGILINAAQVEAKALDMGLGDVNGTVSEGNKILARQALIMEALGSQGALGDFEKTSGGLANQQRILSARLKNVGITIGTALLPVAGKLAEAVSNLIAVGERFAPQMEQLRDRAKELGEEWLPKLREAFIRVRKAVEPIILKMVEFIKTNPKPFLMGLAAVVGVVLVGAIGAAVVAIAGIVFSVGGLIVAFGLAVAAVAYLWQESETFRDVTERVFKDVKAVVTPIIEGIIKTVEGLIQTFQGVLTFLKGVFKGDFSMAMDGIKDIVWGLARTILAPLEAIKGAFTTFFSLDAVQTAIRFGLDKIMDFVKAIPDRVGKLADGAFDALKNAFKSALNWIIDQWNKLDFGFKIEIPSWVPGIGGKGFGIDDVIPDIPRIGGAAPLAPAALLPSTAMRETTAAPVVTTINVVAPNVDPNSLIDSVRRYNRSSGPAPVDIGFY